MTDFLSGDGVSVWVVALAALVTAIMTGVGALPFLFARRLDAGLVGVANGVAAGLMLAASHGLVAEASRDDATLALLGLALGLAAIVAARRVLPDEAEMQVANLEGAGARKALLILGVMTAHSFAEGVGVGVSFGGREALGAFVTIAIAFHNVPEGLAISLVLVPRGTPVWKAAGWSVFTSLPQPLMAVPAFLFVEAFRPVLPVGLGFAAGAMIWMVFAELVPDALERSDANATAIAVTLAFIAMNAVQMLLLPH